MHCLLPGCTTDSKQLNKNYTVSVIPLHVAKQELPYMKSETTPLCEDDSIKDTNWLLENNSYHDEAHSSDTCYLVTYLDSTPMASAFFLVVMVSVAHYTPKSIFVCLFFGKILQYFLLSLPLNHFHILEE